VSAGDTMQGLIKANRAVAAVSLEMAIAIEEICNRYARDEQEHEYTLYRIAKLKSQRESTPPSVPRETGAHVGAALHAAGGCA
jgi:hypothetical protein